MARGGSDLRVVRGGSSPGRNGAAADAPGRRTTLDDVARLTGVSAATVSRAFTEGSSITAEKRARILSVAAEIGYRPNVMARAIATRRSHVVALILFNETNLAYPEVQLSLCDAFARHRMRVMLFPLEEQEDLDEVIGQILSYQVDGVVSAAPIPEPLIRALNRARVPTVFYNRPAEDLTSSSVSCDHRGAGQLIAARVAAAGHRRVALIRGYDESVVGEERMAGVTALFGRHGVEVAASVEGDFTYEGGMEATRGWLREGPLTVTAIVAANDAMAMGAKDVLVHEAGLDVPGDVSVVGFDGTHASHWLSYALTTVGQPIERMASATAAIMMERIADADMLQEQRLFPGLMIEGRSLADVTPGRGSPASARVRPVPASRDN